MRISLYSITPLTIYLEWIKASLRTALPQSTREQLLLEVATTYKLKTVVREKFNIFIFIFFCRGAMKQMKQTFKHSAGIEKEKSWKHLFQLLQSLVIHYLEICEIPPNTNQTAWSNDFSWKFSQKHSYNWMRCTSRKIKWYLSLVKMIPFKKNFDKNATEFSWAIYRSSVPELFCQRCFWKFRKIFRKSPVLESLLNKATAHERENLLKNRLRHRCFPVNFAKFSRTLSLHDCLVFHYFKRDLSLCIPFRRIRVLFSYEHEHIGRFSKCS